MELWTATLAREKAGEAGANAEAEAAIANRVMEALNFMMGYIWVSLCKVSFVNLWLAQLGFAIEG